MANWTKGMIMGMEGGGTVRFYYNPKTVSVAKATKWNHLPTAGRSQPILQYGCGEVVSYDFEFQIGRSGGDGKVKEQIEALLKMCEASTGGNVKRPPKVRLVLGSTISETCVIDSVKGVYGPLWSPSLQTYNGKIHIKLTKFEE